VELVIRWLIRLAAAALLALMIFNTGFDMGYVQGRCETKCGQPPRTAEKDENVPSVLVCTCVNGDVWRLAF
jgi:hypothetical protein